MTRNSSSGSNCCTTWRAASQEPGGQHPVGVVVWLRVPPGHAGRTHQRIISPSSRPIDQHCHVDGNFGKEPGVRRVERQ